MGIYDGTHLVGGMTADWWGRDPQRMAFVAARYKAVARLLTGKRRVLEVGCADGFFSRIVRQHVGYLCAVDVDDQAIAEAMREDCGDWPVYYMTHDILKGPARGFDACYALDVLEHMHPETEEMAFLTHMRESAPVCILGSPSHESQGYASELSRKGHVNCKTEAEMRESLSAFWSHVFLFGMNDEVLHTGFGPMCHYRLAVCVA